ncbi:MAG: ABC transporter ATP-binding protein, partial [Actinomycetes bacterium]
VLDLITDLNRGSGTTVAIVLHDLNLAARYADHLIAMKDGRIVAEGAPSGVVTEKTVADVFGLESRVIPDPVSGTPMVVPMGRHHAGHGGTTAQATPGGTPGFLANPQDGLPALTMEAAS